jgi:hypothetical protein
VRRVDAATAPRVLWQGPGHFHSSFGASEETDIPAAEVVRPGTLLVQQITEVVANRGSERPKVHCTLRKARKEKKAEISF